MAQLWVTYILNIVKLSLITKDSAACKACEIGIGGESIDRESTNEEGCGDHGEDHGAGRVEMLNSDGLHAAEQDSEAISSSEIIQRQPRKLDI